MKFDYGETVKILEAAPARYQALGRVGEVCGITDIKFRKASEQFDAPIGSIVYLVEAPCGNAIEVPERYLTSW